MARADENGSLQIATMDLSIGGKLVPICQPLARNSKTSVAGRVYDVCDACMSTWLVAEDSNARRIRDEYLL